MPKFDESEDGVTFTANPLWRGHDAGTRSLLSADLRGGFDLHADLDDDDSHVAYTANPLSPATRAAQ